MLERFVPVLVRIKPGWPLWIRSGRLATDCAGSASEATETSYAMRVVCTGEGSERALTGALHLTALARTCRIGRW